MRAYVVTTCLVREIEASSPEEAARMFREQTGHPAEAVDGHTLDLAGEALCFSLGRTCGSCGRTIFEDEARIMGGHGEVCSECWSRPEPNP